MPHRAEKLLVDMRISIEEIEMFTKGRSFDEFSKERILQVAIEREFEIIGEALNRLEKIEPEKLSQKIPEYRAPLKSPFLKHCQIILCFS